MKKVKISLLKNIWLILLIVIFLIPLTDLLRNGLPIGHDTQDHVARIANFYQNIQEGNVVPRWAGNLNWGYGHPILMFLYPLPSYTASLFHFLGFSLVDSVKIVFALGFFLSGLTMYLWIKEIFGRKAGFVSALLYIFAPYRFIDLYVRGAIGENFFFIWPPLVCYFLYKLSKQYKWIYFAGGAISTGFMILSHNALTIMFLPFIFFYYLILLFKIDTKKLLFTTHYLLFTFFGFALSAFFWLPAFFEGKYTLRDIVTSGEYADRFESLSRLIYSNWNFGGSGQFSVEVGIVQWLIVLLSSIVIVLITFQKFKNPACAGREKLKIILFDVNTILIFMCLIFFWMAIFFTLIASKPLYEMFTVLQKFQFPWRFLSLAIFSPAIIGGVLISVLPKKLKTSSSLLILLTLLLLNKDYWKAKDYQIKPESFYSGIYYGTTDTGESAPIWSVRFMEKEAKAPIEIVEGEGETEIVERKITKHIYLINVDSERARVLENTLYFPGWNIYVDGKELDLKQVWFQDPNYRGLINFFLNKGEHEVVISFGETKMRKYSNIISLVSILGLIFISSFFSTFQKPYAKHKNK